VSGRRAGRALLVEGYGGVGLIVRALQLLLSSWR